MAHGRKHGFFSSLFAKRERIDLDNAALLESRVRLHQRIQEILAERAKVPALLPEEPETSLALRKEDPGPEWELLPISASVMSRPKVRVPEPFWVVGVEAERPQVGNAH